MKIIVPGFFGLAFCIYVIYNTIDEWLTYGVITVHGKGMPDIVFSGDNLVLGAAINFSFAIACFFLTIGFPLFNHDSDGCQSLGIKSLHIGGLLLLSALALGFYAFHFVYAP